MTNRRQPEIDSPGRHALPVAVLLLLFVVVIGCSSPDPLQDPTGGSANWPTVSERGYDAKECFTRASVLHGRALKQEDTAVRHDWLRQSQTWRRLGLSKDPDNGREHERYIAVCQQLGRDDPKWLRRVVFEYRRLHDANPDSSLYSWLYAWTLTFDASPQSLRTARAVLVRALEADPHGYWLNYRMGMICMALEDADGARLHLRRAAETGPALGRFDASYVLGQLHAGMGEFSDAARCLQVVVDHDRSAGMEVYENLARMLVNTGQYERAKQVLLHDLPPWMIATRGPHHLRTVGAVYLAEGDFLRAADAWRTWLRLFPRAPVDQRIEVEEALDEVEWQIEKQR